MCYSKERVEQLVASFKTLGTLGKLRAAAFMAGQPLILPPQPYQVTCDVSAAWMQELLAESSATYANVLFCVADDVRAAVLELARNAADHARSCGEM